MNRKASLLFIFVTLAIDSIGLGIVIPVLPDVIRKFVTGEVEISRIYGYFIAIYAVMQFVCSPLLGSLSDRFGRRPILLVSLAGAAIDYFFMAFAPTLPLLFVGRVISGVSGASYTVASAYIADISTDENRSKNFGIIGAGFGLGFILGPMIGGTLAGYGSHYPFIAAGVFNLINFLFGLFVLPESLPRELRRKIDRAALNPLRSIASAFKMPEIRALLVVSALMNLAGQTHPSIWTLYTQHRFGWTTAQVGLSLAMVGVLSAISQGALTGVLVKKFGDKRILIYGLLGETITFFLFGWATTGTLLLITLAFSSLCWASQPALQSLISREVPPQNQGELQGTIMSLASFASIINPLVTTTLFAFTSERGSQFYLPGSPYFLAGVFLFAAWVIAVRRLLHHHVLA
jgi:DHA1 family tetracycline resistance protein-like MFS transporter